MSCRVSKDTKEEIRTVQEFLELKGIYLTKEGLLRKVTDNMAIREMAKFYIKQNRVQEYLDSLNTRTLRTKVNVLRKHGIEFKSLVLEN